MNIPKDYMTTETMRKLNPHLAGAPARAVAVFDEAVSHTKEAELQRDAYKWLLLNGATCISWHRMDKPSGNMAGYPDFSFSLNGQMVFAEAKMPGRKATEAQAKFLAQAAAEGHLAFVFYSVDELRENITP